MPKQTRPARPIGTMQQSTATAEPPAPATGQGIKAPTGGHSYLGGNDATPGGTIGVPDTRPAQSWREVAPKTQRISAPVGADEEASGFHRP